MVHNGMSRVLIRQLTGSGVDLACYSSLSSEHHPYYWSSWCDMYLNFLLHSLLHLFLELSMKLTLDLVPWHGIGPWPVDNPLSFSATTVGRVIRPVKIVSEITQYVEWDVKPITLYLKGLWLNHAYLGSCRVHRPTNVGQSSPKFWDW